MKIVHISTGLDIGGAEIMLERLLTLHPEHRGELVVISLQDVGPIGSRLRKHGFNVITMNMVGKLGFPMALWRLVRLLKQLKPDLVQTWMYHADLLGGVAARLAGVPCVVWGIHCSRLPLGRPLTKIVMKACSYLSSVVPDAIVAVAEEAKKNHIAYGYQPDKFHVIPNGFIPGVKFEMSAVEQLKNSLGLHESGRVLGSVGRYHPDKGQDILVQALALLPRDVSWQCVLVGKGCDEQNSELSAALKQYDLAERVKLLGLREDVQLLLQCFDVFCLPSRSEAFPMALGEAMSVGLTCVATDVGDCAELVGETGFVVAAHSAPVLAEALSKTLTMSQAQLRQLGDMARQRVLQHFDLRVVSQSYMQLYLELTDTLKKMSE
ncbi:glycosyltransferase [Rheinheimera sp.]|uniref:glycosyltransferase n=1 Tax=Rheinheimera sp. TaxID=1869214 RepID=UPI003AF838CE